ncbi:MAG: beta-lactamase family protein [Chthoniobacterales bacterium]|nr:beta-lactamase family protein [Chthoniobacterales bacterium]
MISPRAPFAARVAALFEENFIRGNELGAAVSIWQDGREVLELHGGFRDAQRQNPWTNDTLVLFWSATKGLGSATLLHVLQEQRIGLERRVAEFWPEFAASGKEDITLAQLLSHQAGLAALDDPVAITDYDAVVRALARQKPLWPPGTAHGYHARTFGFLLDELVRRIDGRTLGDYWREIFAGPLELDLWIGLPASENFRTATSYAAKAGVVPQPAAFYEALATPGTLARKVFTSPQGLNSVSAMNDPAKRALAVVSLGGIGSASALGKFYALLANGGELDGQRFFTAATLAQMITTCASGIDRVFGIATAFSAGFMKDPSGAADRIFGPSPLAFGHPGAGGSHAFADPENGLAFAYVMNQMEQALLPNEKSLRLVRALYGDARPPR